jgi:hypothetical protein
VQAGHPPASHSNQEGLVLGPLPPLHRLVVSVVALLVCAAAGAWLALSLPLSPSSGPTWAGPGVALGAGLGAVLGLIVVRDGGATRPLRARERRLR